MTKRYVLLDTDIGDDIDDALALLMLLKMEEITLVGVTTVFANTPLRARLAKRILHLSGNPRIPVYAGLGDALAYQVDKQRSFVQYTRELEDARYRADNSDPENGEEAVDFLLEQCERYGENLTILAIGPYTNVAAAWKKAPETLKKAGRVVLMGGCFYEQFVEYNVAMDPEAADVLIRAELPTRFIGADVTWKVQLNDEQTKYVLGIQNDGLSGYCAELVRLWKKGCWFNPVLHDPLAAYYVLDETICQMEPVWVETELRGTYTRGLTVNMDHFYKYLEHPTAGKKRVLCAKSVDADRFIRFFLESTFPRDALGNGLYKDENVWRDNNADQ